jgi:DNA integrity scanning protein DisA with diadenylate cyclase activity
VFSRDSELKFYSESGDAIEALMSKRLLLSIFNKNSPLHDGAVIIYNGRIKAARCVLPISESERLPAQFGLRHRAALGMSEVTDTITLVVSEESGQFSLARNGELLHNLSPQEIRKLLNDYLTYDKALKEKEKVSEKATETQILSTEANAGI